MLAERYRHLVQLGVGRDGIAYRTIDSESENTIELRLLTAAQNDPDRWPNLVRRLRLAARFHHPLVRTPLNLRLDEDPPTIVQPFVDSSSLAMALTPKLPLPTDEVVLIGHRLADVLSAAHRFGLTHGRLDPNRVFIDSQQKLCLDFTGLDVGETTSLFPSDESRRPHLPSAKPFDDIKDLGKILLWMTTGHHSLPQDDRDGRVFAQRTKETSPESSLFLLIRRMLAIEPDDRPSAAEIERQLFVLLDTHSATRIVSPAHCDVTCGKADLAVAPSRLLAESNEVPKQLGRFRLLNKIGSGGMGVVYRAEDSSDGSIVAVKVPLRDFQTDAEARLRLRKEGRLLAEVQNPFVARLLEVNEDAGLVYLAMEFVEGPTLRRVLDEDGAMNEAMALAVIADAARALVEAHRLGIVHRDIKLENLVRVREGDSYRVKLLDFGLARHVNQSESMQLTQTGHRVGTPLYMAPEQCRADGVVDPRTDVYALGANLFHLLAGRPPFEGKSLVQMVAQHCNEVPPNLSRLRPDLSEGVCRLIAKALSKLPQDRYADAGELLGEIERLQRGEPTTLTEHPHLPAHNPKKVISYEWSWQLESKVEQVWPLVSNTERLNRAIGLPAIDYTFQTDSRGGTHRFGQFRKFGLTVAWEEHPFEWIENRRMAVLRQYHSGPFKWLISQVELTPRLGDGALLTHRVHVLPLGLLGRLLAARQIGVETRRALDRVYRRIDAVQSDALGKNADAFEAPARLPRGGQDRLHLSLGKLVRHGVERGVAETLGEFLERAPVQEVARIRPLALAERLRLPSEQVVAACLYGAREGLLVLLWDILCPLCRIPTEIKDTLRELEDHGHCEACNLDFKLDFAQSVELIFRVHPAIRSSEVGAYCAGGPAHSPHVVAQVRVATGERMALNLDLAEGSYRLRGPQLAFTVDFRVHPAAQATRWELDLCRGPEAAPSRTLKVGGQTFVLTNDAEKETIVRIERAAGRSDALTAARAASLPLFRKMFPEEVLSAGQLIGVTNLTFLVTASQQASGLYCTLGDNAAFAVINKHLRSLEDYIHRESGSVVKTVEEGIVAVFHDTVAAVRVACELQTQMAEDAENSALRLRVGVHRGPALVSTINDRMDYFGSTIKLALALSRLADDGEVLLSEAVATDPHVAAWVHGRRVANELSAIRPAALPDCIVQRLRPQELLAARIFRVNSFE